jgi:uncharacterized membrane protein YgdD (TMEM256/DUF423 family)
MDKIKVAFASFYIAFAILLGALGAHALKNILTSDQLASFEVGVRYQLFTGLALLFFGTQQQLFTFSLKPIFKLLMIGSLLFSVSIYLLLLFSVLEIPKTALVPLTPIGGVLMIVSWIVFAIKVFKQ